MMVVVVDVPGTRLPPKLKRMGIEVHKHIHVVDCTREELRYFEIPGLVTYYPDATQPFKVGIIGDAERLQALIDLI